MAGWTIRLDDGTSIATTSTDRDGAYRFRDLVPGGYQVSESPLPGWSQTFPASGVHDVAVEPSEVIAGLDFGNFSQLGSGSGRVDSLRAELSQGNLVLTWGPSCVDSDVDYAVYEGDLGDWTSHAALQCSTNGVPILGFSPPSGSTYYLVVPRNFVFEGSYGDAQLGLERPQGGASCTTQSVNPCP